MEKAHKGENHDLERNGTQGMIFSLSWGDFLAFQFLAFP